MRPRGAVDSGADVDGDGDGDGRDGGGPLHYKIWVRPRGGMVMVRMCAFGKR